VTCFSKKQCENIQGRFHPMSLSKMGINRNMPKAVVSGPTRYGGLDIRELWTITGWRPQQSNCQLPPKRRPSRRSPPNRNGSTAAASRCILARPQQNGEHDRKYVPKFHASHTWAFNDKYDLSIEYEEDPWILPQHEHDKFIMEEVAKLPNIKACDLKYIQRC